MALPQATVTPGTGLTINTLQNGGQNTAANSHPVVIASDQSAVAVTGTFFQATQPVSLTSVPSHAVTNAGTFAVQDSVVGPAAGTIADSAYAGSGSATMIAALKGIYATINSNSTAALPTGSNVIGGVTQSGTWNVTVNAALPTGTNSIGAVTSVAEGTTADAAYAGSGSATTIAALKGVYAAINSVSSTALPAGTATIGGVVLKPSAAAPGQTATRVVAAATTNATSLKASAGNIVNIDVFNVAAYTVFLKIYDKASAPTVGTDTPIMTVPIPAGTGFSREYLFGKPCTTGIAYAITKLQADSDTTALVAGDVTGAISWI